MAGVVVISGASTGIGLAAARHLRGLGFDVVAGVRSDEDAARLAGEGLTPVRLDVTDPDSIAAAGEIARARGPITAVVANAGIGDGGPLEVFPLERMRRLLEVNVVGVLALIQEFLPDVRASRGRVVITGSVGGRVAAPFNGPYSATKHALEALADSLRREVAPFGVQVSLLEPGSVATPIWEKARSTIQSVVEDVGPERLAPYARRVERARRLIDETAAAGIPAEEVAAAIGHALTADKPKTRYLLGKEARQMVLAQRLLRDRGFDRVIARRLPEA